MNIFRKRQSTKPEETTPSEEDPGTLPNKEFLIRTGCVTGTSHKRSGINNQDSWIARTIEVDDKAYTVGIVSDGCTGKKKQSRTEVGSALLTLYAFSEIRMLLSRHVPIQEIPAILYSRCVSYVGNQARCTVAGSVEEMASFIENFFLCTLLGFIKNDTELVTFSSGDGFFVINDNDLIIDHENKPVYLAYHQIDRRLLGEHADNLPDSFETASYDLQYLDRFAVGTDGLVQKNPDSGELYLDTEEREAIFKHRTTAPAGLQWWLNKQQNRYGRFSDDTTIITLTLKGGETDEGPSGQESSTGNG